MSLPFGPRLDMYCADAPLAVRLATIRYGTPGDDYFRGSGDYDMSQGGNDRLRLGGTNDTVYFGAAFTGADRVNGGKGVDTVTLDGDYSTGIEVRADSLAHIEKLVLEGGPYFITGELDFADQFGTTLVDARGMSASQSLHLDVASAGALDLLAGAGDDVLHASESGGSSQLYAAAGNDTLIGGDGDNLLVGGGGADTLVMHGSGDVAAYVLTSDSAGKTFDVIENLEQSGGRIRIVFDSDTSTPERDLDFHLGKTAGHAGDIRFKYDAAANETVLKVFTDHDKVADFVLHLTGDVQLTTADFIFG